MAKNVTTIPATRNRFTAAPISSRKKRRVAGYARVSTDMPVLIKGVLRRKYSRI